MSSKIRTRFAPSPTGYMHIGNLRTALYEFLIAKSKGGDFILRIEDTDQERLVEGSTDVIYKTLKTSGLKHDEGPDVGGEYGPYVQSERKGSYLEYAKKLVENGNAYYCFCTKDRLETIKSDNPDSKDIAKYDKHCTHISEDEIKSNLENDIPFVIRQRIPDGKTTFSDEVYGDITVDNEEIEDQILVKSDGLPTYNFANVVDDHLMNITHVVRGSEYLSSTPKYNLLYSAFDWEIPTYIHLPLILNKNGEKLSKRKGDASFEDLLAEGFLPEAIMNYIALLGWSPADNNEFFSLEELISAFDTKGLSKSPSVFDVTKLTWMNTEYFKKMDDDKFYELAINFVNDVVKREDVDKKFITTMCKSRVSFAKEISGLVDFIDELPEYEIELYNHKKMKTDREISLNSLENLLPILQNVEWEQESLHNEVMKLVETMGVKNGQVLWPLRTALSGKPSSPCGATELAILLGKDDTLLRIEKGIEKLK